MTQQSINIAPVSKEEGLAEQIVRQLIALVTSGELRSGDRLPAERALANDLGVGRPTLREALRALQLLGVLDIRHGGGVFVSELQPDTLLAPLHLFLSLDGPNVEAILEARRVIEGAFLSYMAHSIDAVTVEKLEANLAALAQLVDGSADSDFDAKKFTALAEQFRQILEEAADNPILVKVVKSLDILSAATRNRITAPNSGAQLLKNHRRMVEALIRHDSVAAQQALETHIDYLCSAWGVALRDRTHA